MMKKPDWWSDSKERWRFLSNLGSLTWAKSSLQNINGDKFPVEIQQRATNAMHDIEAIIDFINEVCEAD